MFSLYIFNSNTMKRFLSYILAFSFLVIITLAGGEYFIKTLPNSYKYKHQYVINNATDIECIIMGNSHTYYGINPKIFKSKTFNLANVSQNPKYDYLLLDKYISICPNLNIIIYPISYCTYFDENFEDSDEWYYAINYKLYMDVNLHSNFSKYNFEISNRSVYSGKLKSVFLGNRKALCDSLGFGLGYNLISKDSFWEINSYHTVNNHTADNWSALKENISYLEMIVKLCQDNRITLILITTPTWHTYHSLLNEKQLNKMYEITDSICYEYNLLYLDYLKDSRFVEDDFYDCDHLSDVGAAKFTAILKYDIEGDRKTQKSK